MPLLLAGDHPACTVLREQYARARVRHVKLSGVGFFVEYEVPADASRTAQENFAGGTVTIAVEGVEHGAGCLVFVRCGVLSFLEGYTYGGDEWPEHPMVRDLRDVVPISP
jgi:hypothetical protein